MINIAHVEAVRIKAETKMDICKPVSNKKSMSEGNPTDEEI